MLYIDWDGDHTAATDVVGKKSEVAVGWNEGKNLLGFPSLEPDAGVERSVVEQSRIDEVHGEVRHSGQLNGAVDVAVDLRGDGGP